MKSNEEQSRIDVGYVVNLDWMNIDFKDIFNKLTLNNQIKALKFATLSDNHYGFMKHFLIKEKHKNKHNSVQFNIIQDFQNCCNYTGNKPHMSYKFKDINEYNKWKKQYLKNLNLVKP